MSGSGAMTSWSHEVYKWPALIPLFEKPTQPPTRTVLRFFQPEPDESICKRHYDYAQDSHSSHRCKKIEKRDDSVLIDRDEYMKKAQKLKKSFKNERLRSTYQIGFGAVDDLTYDNIINQLRKKSDKRPFQKLHEAKNLRPDPFPFRKTLDKRVILTDYPDIN